MKTILISLLMLTATVARAQITIAEPKFEQEATIVMNDTAGVELQLEYAIQKRTENVGTAILFGEGNKSLYYEISGAKSPVTLSNDCYEKDLQLIFSWSDNRLSPKRLIQIFPLEIQKKRRIYNVGDYDVVSNTETYGQENCVKFTAEKYGTHSYLITIPKSELMALRDGNLNEAKKFGKQYLIHIIAPATNNTSATECFLTFGIEKPTLPQLNYMNTLQKEHRNNRQTPALLRRRFWGSVDKCWGHRNKKHTKQPFGEKPNPVGT